MTKPKTTPPKIAVPTGLLDQFNLEVPERFPEHSLNPRAAQNIVNSEAMTDANPLLLKVNFGAGHGGASGRYDALRETAFNWAFVLWQVGRDRPTI